MRCEGWRRHGGAFSIGPAQWVRCNETAITNLTCVQEGETEVIPACNTCWGECLERGISIIKAEPLSNSDQAATGEVSK